MEASYVTGAAIANRVHFRLGHPNLQRIGSAAESDQSVLDAPAFGDSETASGRAGRIRYIATGGPTADRVPIVLAVFAVDPVRASHEMTIALNELPASRLTHQRESRACPPALM